MRITDIKVHRIHLLIKPEFVIVSSAGKHAESHYVIVQITTDAGITGWGEATVVPNWSGETQGSAFAAINDYMKPVLIGRDPTDVPALMADVDGTMFYNWFAKAAVEMALLDIAAQAKKQPVYEYLGGAKNPLRIPIKFSIGLREPENAAQIAIEKVSQGFTALKFKVGPDPEKDLLRVKLVREAVGPDIRLNIDTNGGWSVEESIREIPRYLPFNLEYVEQPVPRWDIDGLAKVRANSPLPIMADEGVFDLWQADEVLRKKAADCISIYPGKNGGILKSMEIAKRAQGEGVACHIGSNLEWHLGTAAMCQLAAACANVQVSRFPVDILGPLYYARAPRQRAIEFERGHVHVPTGPGLGMQLTEDEIREMGAA
jgi:muconate cycloisomerase